MSKATSSKIRSFKFLALSVLLLALPAVVQDSLAVTGTIAPTTCLDIRNAANLQWPEAASDNATLRAKFRPGLFPPTRPAGPGKQPTPTPTTTPPAPNP